MSVILTGFNSSIGTALMDKFISEKKHVFCLGRKKNYYSNSVDKEYKSFFYLDFASKNFEFELDEIYLSLSNKKISTIIHAAADSGKREYIKYKNYRDISNLINTNYLNSAWFLKKSCDLLCLNKNSVNKSFVYISTQLAKHKGPGLSIYSSAKAAMNNLCKTLAYEYGPDNIRINIVTPGIISTNPLDNNIYNPDLKIPLSRLATAQDVLNAVNFLITQESSYITGCDIDVNGGR